MIKKIHIKMKKILITGGAGFIGSSLCKFLLKKKYQIVVYDNLSTGKLNNLPKNIKFIKADIRNKKLLIKHFDKFKYVIHLAAKSALQETIGNPSECIDINILGTQNILDMCLKHNSKLIFASTCAVYPLDLKKKAREEDEGGFITPYSISKISSEKLIEFYAKKKGLKAIVLRFFNVYGKNQNANSQYSGVIAKFIKRAKNNLNLELYNGGVQKRDFIHVNDVCEAIYKSGVDMSWTCTNGIRVESADDELFKTLRKSGCYRVSFGFESGNDEVLKAFGKGGRATVKQAKKAVKSARAAGIDTNGYFMVGLSADTEKSMDDTINLARALPLDMMKFGVAIAFPGTKMFNDYVEKGLVRSFDWDEYMIYTDQDLFAHKNLS